MFCLFLVALDVFVMLYKIKEHYQHRQQQKEKTDPLQTIFLLQGLGNIGHMRKNGA